MNVFGEKKLYGARNLELLGYPLQIFPCHHHSQKKKKSDLLLEKQFREMGAG
jgi:hypothetical protein